jgi:hypothetical protein
VANSGYIFTMALVAVVSALDGRRGAWCSGSCVCVGLGGVPELLELARTGSWDVVEEREGFPFWNFSWRI